MNNLQKIEEVFGEKFCPTVNVVGNTTHYSARQKDNGYFQWQSPTDLLDFLRKGKEMGMRIGVDMRKMQYDVYFNN